MDANWQPSILVSERSFMISQRFYLPRDAFTSIRSISVTKLSPKSTS